MASEVTSAFSTVSDVMNLMAPSAGGSVPNEDSEEFAQWLTFIQLKYEEASRRGFWRRLLEHELLALEDGDEEVLLPVRFGRANALYVLEVDEIDYADPFRDKTTNDQSVWAVQINDPDDDDFARWKLIFKDENEFTGNAHLWYFATPPKPTESDDKLLLPGDMIAFGALAEYFRSTNLEGSQDDARQEFENRLQNYLAMEMIPPRNELLTFTTNPRAIDRLSNARRQYTIRTDRTRNV